MSYPFSHIFIPLSILFIFSNKLDINTKNIIFLSFFGILPDFDVIFTHRLTFHNIFFVSIIPLLFLLILKNKEIASIVYFYLSSHLILDLFNGGIAGLYPIYDKIFFINAEIVSNVNINSIRLILDYGIKGNFVNDITEYGKYGIISSENFGTIILIMIIVFVIFIGNKLEF